MVRVNSNFCLLRAGYLFTEIVNRTAAYKQSHPEADIIRLGIGDVPGPLTPCVIEAMHRAVEAQADKHTFHGYGLEQGPAWMREQIAAFDYQRRGIAIAADEVFVSDGAGSDLGNLSDILGTDNRVAITDPVYPAYVDTNVMAGRAGEWQDEAGQWSRLLMLPSNAENGFCPVPPAERADIIYLCSPNNPTGIAMNRQQLQVWVDYARANRSLIIFDSAYEAFIQSPDVPHSIYEIAGAKECAIEVRSFSKTAGFTGIRCGYTIVPKALYGVNDKGEEVSLNALWYRRQCTKYNGTSIISLRGAQAVLTEEGHEQVMAQIAGYMDNARRIREGLSDCGLAVYGGTDGPYVWVRVPKGMGSWAFFDWLLDKCQVVCTPGVGFGKEGEGYVRFSAFGDPERTEEAVRRIKTHPKPQDPRQLPLQEHPKNQRFFGDPARGREEMTL